MTSNAPLIDVVQQELEEYRRSGRALHLAHAARALQEALAAMSQDQADVAVAEKGR